jgi:hypothetical protein
MKIEAFFVSVGLANLFAGGLRKQKRVLAFGEPAINLAVFARAPAASGVGSQAQRSNPAGPLQTSFAKREG